MYHEAPSSEYVLQLIRDRESLATGSWKLMFGLKLLHKHYADLIPENQEHVLFALSRATLYVRYLDVFNFRSLVSFAQRYNFEEREVWKTYLSNLVRIIVSYEQLQKPLLSSASSEIVREEFITVFDTVVERALHFKFELDPLITQLDLMMRNHYRYLFAR